MENLQRILSSLPGPLTLTILITGFLMVKPQLSEMTQFFLGYKAL